MRFRTWPVAALALGALLVLVVISVLESSTGLRGFFTGISKLRMHRQT